jgi:hypothetical protein
MVHNWTDAPDAASRRDMRAIGSDYFEATTFWGNRGRYYAPLGIEEDIMTPLGVEYSPYWWRAKWGVIHTAS